VAESDRIEKQYDFVIIAFIKFLSILEFIVTKRCKTILSS
jgi:hypothetical protein